jgi:hypothetical protein
MTPYARTAIFVIVTAVSVSTARAQEPREVIGDGLRPGDTLTVTTKADREVKGRFVGSGDDGMVLTVRGTERRFPWTDIDRVRRRRNGILLGAIIGAGAGVAAGLPLASLVENETGDGEKALASMIALGLGAGIGLDALLSTNRTLYDRRAQTRINLLPQKGGAVLRVSLAW